MDDARAILDRFFSIRTGARIADVKPGQVAVATCERRTFAELGYGFVLPLWLLHFGDRVVISVHPAALAEVSRLAWRLTPDEVFADDFVVRAGEVLQSRLPGITAPAAPVGGSIALYHPGGAEPIPCDGEVRPLTPADAARWQGDRRYMTAAEHPSATRGEAFGVFLGDALVADIMTHDPSVAEMAHLVAEDGIEVAEAYHRRGYGRAVLSAWTHEMQRRGRACLHSTSLDNEASIRVAKSVGYHEYARKRSVSYHPPEG